MSTTYNPKKKKRVKTHGFLARSRTPGGVATMRRRRSKGRRKISA